MATSYTDKVKRKAGSSLISDKSRFVIVANALSCSLGSGYAILDIHANNYFSLNNVGAFVWETLRDPTSMKDLRSAMIARYECNPEQCAADLDQLIVDFYDAGLIRALAPDE